MKRKEMDAMNKRNAYELANDADVTTPDSPESHGATFLLSVQDAVLEAIEYNREQYGEVSGDDLRDNVSDIIDGLVPIYTYQKWMTFVDLAAWQEDASEMFGSDVVKVDEALDQLSDIALNQIADRLAYRLIESWERDEMQADRLEDAND
jgi:hypothetical protein